MSIYGKQDWPFDSFSITHELSYFINNLLEMHLKQTDFDVDRLHAQLELTTHRDTVVIFKSSGDVSL